MIDNENNLEQEKEETQESSPTTEEEFKLGDERRYRDLEGVTLKKLNIGLWYVEHKKHLLYLLYGVLIVISIITWPLFFYRFGVYIIQGMQEDEKTIKEMVKTSGVDHNFILQIGARDLEYYSVKVLKPATGKYDFVVKIKNPNEKYYAHFQYKFIAGNKIIGPLDGFIFPQEEKYLVSLGNEFSSTPRQVKLVLENIKWRRVDPRKYPNWSEFYQTHLGFTVQDTRFIPAKLSKLSEKLPINRLEFSISNNTAYNYWDIDLVILLLSRGKIVGVNKHTINNFMSGEERDIEMSWPGRIGYVDDVKVIPEVDILNENVYIPFK